MQRVKHVRWLAGLIVLGAIVSAAAADSGNRVFDRTVEIVRDRFFAPGDLATFNETVAQTVGRTRQLGQAAPGSPVVGNAIDTVLASLAASHTARYVQNQRDYYELIDIFRHAIGRGMGRPVPPA